MNKLLASLMLLAFGVCLVPGVRAEGTLDKVKKQGVLVVGVLNDVPPFSYMKGDPDEVVGYDVDFAAAIANKLGVKLKLKVVTPQNRISQLVDGSVDLVAANLTHSEDHPREAVVDLSEHYLSTGQKFLAKRGLIKTLADISGKKVGAVVGTPSVSCAKEKCEAIIAFEDYVQAVQALQKGQIDAFTTDEVILVSLLASLPRGEYEIPPVQISEEQFHLAVRKGDKAFLDFVDKAISDLQASGDADRLREKWFAPRDDQQAVAYGAVVRKAATRPRFLGVLLKGAFVPKTEVSVYALDGGFLGRGYIVGTLDDEFYLDVEWEKYDLVRPGFLVAANMEDSVARGVVIQHQDLLRSVKADAEKAAAELRAQIEKEGIEKERRAKEIDMMRERSRLTVEEERALYFRNYRYR